MRSEACDVGSQAAKVLGLRARGRGQHQRGLFLRCRYVVCDGDLAVGVGGHTGVRLGPAARRLRAEHAPEQAHEARRHRLAVDDLPRHLESHFGHDVELEIDRQLGAHLAQRLALDRVTTQELQATTATADGHRAAALGANHVELGTRRRVRRVHQIGIRDRQSARVRELVPDRRFGERIHLQQRRVQRASIDDLPCHRHANRLDWERAVVDQEVG